MKREKLALTQELVGRLRSIVAATTRFATGQCNQHLPARAVDGIRQLEASFNQMAEQLVESMAREKILVEQNARLEEQARLSQNLQEHVRQRIFEYSAQKKILVEQNARLEERARLSRDLHDSVKQQVFALAVQIELARSLLEQDSAAAREHLCEADELSYQIQQELTALIDALRPADLQTKELTAALRDYTTTWSRQSRITADLSLPNICLLPSSIEEALWRVTQEALSNVARHSHASTVQLHLESTEQHVSLSVSDNGQGFETTSREHHGFGLRSIRERIEQVGGTLLIQSSRDAGTRIVVHCPLS
jgi:two-component system, NarL family, sensor histidine kinase LiaS